MATPLTWKTVQRDGGAEKALALAAQAGRDIGSSFASAGDALTEFGANKTDAATDAFIADLMSMGTDAERQAAIAEADKSFLDLGRVAERTYELGADERALETQLAKEQRDLAAQIAQEGREQEYESDIFDRDVKYEEKINKRELLEADKEREKDEKREDYLNMMANKFAVEERLYQEMFEERQQDKGFEQDKELLDIEFNKQQKINNLEFDRARSLITQEYGLKARNAREAAVDAAAAEQAIAEIEAERDIELAKIEQMEKVELKQLEYQADLNEINAKNKAKEGSGINKLMKRYSVNGTIKETDLDSNDVEAFSAANLEMVQNRGITQEDFDEFTGDKVNFVDRKVWGPNYFTFEFRGEEYKFGKELFGVLGIGGNESDEMKALEAAILQSKNDKTVYDTGFSAYKGLMEKEGITNVSESTYRGKWANYVQSIGLKPANLNEFLTKINEL